MKSMGSSQVRIVFAVFAIFMALCSSESAQQGWSLVPINPPIWKHTKKLIWQSEGRVNCNAFPGSSCDLAHRPGSDKETMYFDFERDEASADSDYYKIANRSFKIVGTDPEAYAMVLFIDAASHVGRLPPSQMISFRYKKDSSLSAPKLTALSVSIYANAA
jgi:hypothetical protein